MKRTIHKRKTPRRRRPEPEPEENIFNPFAPLLRGLRRRGRKDEESPKHPFRDTFITVVLVHVIAVLGFMTFGAIRNTTKQASSKRAPEENKVSQVARMIGKQPQLLASEVADPGEKLIAVHEPDPFRTAEQAAADLFTADNSSARAGQKRPVRSEEPLPPVVARPKPPTGEQTIASLPKHVADDSMKEAFLAATGRRAQKSQTMDTPLPEVRRAEAAEDLLPPATRTAQAEAPAPTRYTVQAGDNIFTISRRMKVSFTELAAANNLSSPRDVRIGQVLVSPSAQRDAM